MDLQELGAPTMNSACKIALWVLTAAGLVSAILGTWMLARGQWSSLGSFWRQAGRRNTESVGWRTMVPIFLAKALEPGEPNDGLDTMQNMATQFTDTTWGLILLSFSFLIQFLATILQLLTR